MRYDKRIQFATDGKKSFNYSTGNRDQISTSTYVDAWANVSSQSNEMMQLLYGGLNERSAIIRLQNNYDEYFDHIIMDEIEYRVDKEVKHRRDHVFYVSEIL